ncbi:hypothetical protein SAY87_007840 [Trapa incisa]|uniref:Uncharacterized protein n=1 Tax=Trapa incisa TaxID=236973 RepID=A0AAN7KC83_9MYRT|nr:hypothetical protein SAY87_007840 [Trapa incisa]
MHGSFLTGLREAANMAQYAHARRSRIRIGRSPSENVHCYASLLKDLFREPDLEFGSFTVIFCQKNPNPKSSTILRMAFNESNKRSTDDSNPDQHSSKLLFQQLQSHFNHHHHQLYYMYSLLSKQEALELREVRGGSEIRLKFLCEKGS